MVCITLASPSDQRRARVCRVATIPSGMPMRMANSIALPTSARCSAVSCNTSSSRSVRMQFKAMSEGTRFARFDI